MKNQDILTFKSNNFQTFINDTELNNISFTHCTFCESKDCFHPEDWTQEFFKYTDNDILQVIERNPVSQKLEVSYWVICPKCGYQILLHRVD